MKSYCLRQHKIPRIPLLFIATVIFSILSANISYGAIDVELLAVETSQYPTINAYVKVVDHVTQDPILGLNESNFSIFEDDKPQALTSLIAILPPDDIISVALAMDYSDSMYKEEGAIQNMEAAVLAFIDLLRPDDAIEIIKFEYEIEVYQSFTTDKAAAKDAVIAPWTSDIPGTRLYDALYLAVHDTILSPYGGIGKVLLLSDGKNTYSDHSLDDVISYAKNNGIEIFVIGLGEVGEVDNEVLQRIADETGGIYILAPTSGDLETIFLAMVAELLGGYIVSYETSAKGCRDHELRIRVVNPDFGEGEGSKSFLICPSRKPLVGGGSSSGGNCFIVSAAYGSAMATEVKAFKRFRDEYLLTNELGRTFVSLYYKYSPTVADYIDKYPMLRRMVRIGLYPMLELSKWLTGESASKKPSKEAE